jgi:hypothetical protein
MNDNTRQFIKDIVTNKGGLYKGKWSPERIASWIQKGWAFLGTPREKYEKEKQEIVDYVKTLRGQ